MSQVNMLEYEQKLWENGYRFVCGVDEAARIRGA